MDLKIIAMRELKSFWMTWSKKYSKLFLRVGSSKFIKMRICLKANVL